jgi:hypothetical protein
VTIEDLLIELSDQVWRFIDDAPFRPREETLTEFLLVEMSRRGQPGIWVQKATIGEEVRKGLDWAWAIRTSNGWLHLVVQAKQIDGGAIGVYSELRKKAKAQSQAENLIEGAATGSALPVFAFFNGSIAPFGTTGTVVRQGACGRGTVARAKATSVGIGRGTSPLGVTLADAQDVLEHCILMNATKPRGKSTRAEEVNRYAMPWECLFCPAWRSGASASSVGASVSARKLGEALEGASAIDVPWLTALPPRWATQLMEEGEVRRDEFRPRASYFVVLDPLI